MDNPSLSRKAPLARSLLLIAGAGIVLGFVWFFQIHEPRMTRLRVISQEREEQQQQLTVIRKMRPQRDMLQAEIVQRRRMLDSLRHIFPDRKEIPMLIHEITRLSRESEIYTTRFNPLKDEVREHYVENHFTLTLQGRYHNFAQFLARLASLRLIVNLGEMRIDAHRSLGAAVETQHDYDELPYSILATFRMTTFSSRR